MISICSAYGAWGTFSQSITSYPLPIVAQVLSERRAQSRPRYSVSSGTATPAGLACLRPLCCDQFVSQVADVLDVGVQELLKPGQNPVRICVRVVFHVPVVFRSVLCPELFFVVLGIELDRGDGSAVLSFALSMSRSSSKRSIRNSLLLLVSVSIARNATWVAVCLGFRRMAESSIEQSEDTRGKSPHHCGNSANRPRE